MSIRKKYTKEFKLEAIRLLESKQMSGTDLARHLDVKREHIYRWQEEYRSLGDKAFPGTGRARITSQKDELFALKKELAAVKEERDILKKAAVYFAKELK